MRFIICIIVLIKSVFITVKYNLNDFYYGVIKFFMYVAEIFYLSGFVSSVRRALASKLRGPGFKSWPGTVGGRLTIIMWGARPGRKLALS